MTVVGSVTYNEKYFHQRNPELVRHKHVKSLTDVSGCDVLVLWGGEDINPAFYNQDPVHTWANHRNRRDWFEKSVYEYAVQNGIPLLGVCRGAQLMCALGGGTLWQDVDGHNGTHNVRMADGRIVTVNSIHHQMMRLNPEKTELLGWSDIPYASKRFAMSHTPVVSDEPEPEFVNFKGIGIGVQGHPEYSGYNSDVTTVTCELMLKHYGVQL